MGAPAQLALVLAALQLQLALALQQLLPPGLLPPLPHRLPEPLPHRPPETLLWWAVQVAAAQQAAGA